MAFLSDTGVPFAICVTKVKEGDRAAKTETLSGLATTHWVRDGFGFMIIGGENLDYVQSLAADLSDRI